MPALPLLCQHCQPHPSACHFHPSQLSNMSARLHVERRSGAAADRQRQLRIQRKFMRQQMEAKLAKRRHRYFTDAALRLKPFCQSVRPADRPPKIAPAQRCALDPLSVALRSLDAADFGSAARSCRQYLDSNRHGLSHRSSSCPNSRSSLGAC